MGSRVETVVIAVACWATAAVAETASSGNAAFIRLDIKRRDALTGTITSPLLEVIKAGNPPALRDPVPVPTALDLPQVTASEVVPVKPTPLRRPDTPRTPAAAPTLTTTNPAPDDITDWL